MTTKDKQEDLVSNVHKIDKVLAHELEKLGNDTIVLESIAVLFSCVIEYLIDIFGL